MSAQRSAMQESHPRHDDVPALFGLSALLLGKGLSLPVLTVNQLIVGQSTFFVFSGIRSLFEGICYVLAVIICAFSVVFPIGKLITLLLIWMVRFTDESREWALHWLGLLGKWSMLGVFVVAMIVVIVKIGTWMTDEPRAVIYLFGVSIISSMSVTVLMSRLSGHGVVRL